MIFDNNRKMIRDLDIEELTISFGRDYGTVISLTKEKVTYRNTIHPTIAYRSFPKGYFDTKEIPITPEQFGDISDAIHDSGLVHLIRPLGFAGVDISPGASYQILTCVFDDGAQYEFRTSGNPPEEFDSIVKILSEYCGFQNAECTPEPVENIPGLTTQETHCCHVIVPKYWLFCPKCGGAIDSKNSMESSSGFDVHETMWICNECYEGVPFQYSYCGKCGKKREW